VHDVLPVTNPPGIDVKSMKLEGRNRFRAGATGVLDRYQLAGSDAKSQRWIVRHGPHNLRAGTRLPVLLSSSTLDILASSYAPPPPGNPFTFDCS